MTDLNLMHEMPERQECKCDNCGWIGPKEDLANDGWIREPEQRLMPGCTVPAGECPMCGCLAYLAGEPAQKPVPATVQALYVAAAEVDLHGATIERLRALAHALRLIEADFGAAAFRRSPQDHDEFGYMIATLGDLGFVLAPRITASHRAPWVEAELEPNAGPWVVYDDAPGSGGLFDGVVFVGSTAFEAASRAVDVLCSSQDKSGVNTLRSMMKGGE